jgi:hypothetical protein
VAATCARGLPNLIVACGLLYNLAQQISQLCTYATERIIVSTKTLP